jgi:hypothetical protein
MGQVLDTCRSRKSLQIEGNKAEKPEVKMTKLDDELNNMNEDGNQSWTTDSDQDVDEPAPTEAKEVEQADDAAGEAEVLYQKR